MFNGLVKDSVLLYGVTKMTKKSKSTSYLSYDTGFFHPVFRAKLALRRADLEVRLLEKTRELEAKAEARRNKVKK